MKIINLHETNHLCPHLTTRSYTQNS